MNFEVNLSQFVDLMFPVIDISSKNTIVESKYEYFLTIVAKENEILAYSNGGNASILAKGSNETVDSLSYSCISEGECTVKSTHLNDALKTLDDCCVEISLNGGSFVISQIGKKSNKRTIPTFKEDVAIYKISEKADNSVKINRNVLRDILYQVKFAPPIEERIMSFQCVSFNLKQKDGEQEICAMAGNNARFIYDKMSGSNIMLEGKDLNFIMPSHNLDNLYSILDYCDDEFVDIKYSDEDEKNNIRDQVSLIFGNYELCLVGLENVRKEYPDLMKAINSKYNNSFRTSFYDWVLAEKGISLSMKISKNDDIYMNSNTHNSEIYHELGSNGIIVRTKSKPVNETEIGIREKISCEERDSVVVRCNSFYLKEMIKARSKKASEVTVSFNDMSDVLNGTNEENCQLKPILIEFDEYVDSVTNLKEKVYMFFSTSTK